MSQTIEKLNDKLMETRSGGNKTAEGPSEKIQCREKRPTLLSCPVDPWTLDETLEKISWLIENKVPTQHCVVNAGKFVLMKREKRLRDIVTSCPIINADGQSVVWALRLKGKAIPERVTGIDLMERLLGVAAKKGYRVYFFGARQEVLDRMMDIVKKQHPQLVIAGSRNGYFTNEQLPGILADMRNAKADILFVAMGSPKKEYWLGDHMKETGIPFCMGVGGSFDVVAGKAKRAPRWIQKAGLEWFYRFIQEPTRLWRRYLLGNAIFVGLVLAEILRLRPSLEKSDPSDLADKEIT